MALKCSTKCNKDIVVSTESLYKSTDDENEKLNDIFEKKNNKMDVVVINFNNNKKGMILHKQQSKNARKNNKNNGKNKNSIFEKA